MGACMLLEIFTSTTRNTKLKEHLACGRLADDGSDNQPRFNALGLVRRILFWSHMGACMLLEIYTSTTSNTKLKEHLVCGRLADN
jgi:hypothetical protein